MARLMGSGAGKMMQAAFGTELIYAFTIILISLMIFFATKELYTLTKHKGIKYFRQAFLFFAIAYFVRVSIKFLVHEGIIEISKQTMHFILGPLTLSIFVYFSTMAVFYLIYSALYKTIDKKTNHFYIFHIIAFAIAVLIFIFQNPLVYLLTNLLLFVFILTITLIISIKSKNKKKGSLYTIYVLLFFFWILNIIDILIPNFLHNIQLYIYLASIAIFLTILYKVLKKSG